ncbi:hypothetical protein MRX96_006582 [Rhipicephalus microplus]
MGRPCLPSYLGEPSVRPWSRKPRLKCTGAPFPEWPEEEGDWTRLSPFAANCWVAAMPQPIGIVHALWPRWSTSSPGQMNPLLEMQFAPAEFHCNRYCDSTDRTVTIKEDL